MELLILQRNGSKSESMGGVLATQPQSWLCDTDTNQFDVSGGVTQLCCLA